MLVADSRYRGNAPLTYSFDGTLPDLSVVTVPLRQRMVTGFILRKTTKPGFAVKPIKTILSRQPLPAHCLKLAQWLVDYYACSFGEALRQFAQSQPTVRRKDGSNEQSVAESPALQLELGTTLTKDQAKALKTIRAGAGTTFLLHGDTGTGKTRVYIELAQETLAAGRSVILLTPEIALTSQLAAAVEQQLHNPTYVVHSQLTAASRKKIWLAILESKVPVVIIGPRSALFSPVSNLGLVVVDEAHEPSYKQEHSPRYQTIRVASQLGSLTGAKVVLGTATPLITDYYLAGERQAVAEMRQMAVGRKHTEVETRIIDLKDRTNFPTDPYLSKPLLEVIRKTLNAKKQVMLYLNRRGSARLILCTNCGWQLLCPNCDVPLIYHADSHDARCHICAYSTAPPVACPECQSPDIIYRSIGTKALTEAVAKLFPEYRVQRFDSDNVAGERVNEVYERLRAGEVDILIGTQLLAKGFDLPRLGLVGIIAAETSLALPDYTAEERSFQLLYQVIGRVGRGHAKGQVIIQSYNPGSVVLQAAVERDWQLFYKRSLEQRQQFRFPPYSYLLKLTCRRATPVGAKGAAEKARKQLLAQKLQVEILGPTPSFYARRGRYYYYQLVIKSKQRSDLLKLSKIMPPDWTIDLDPADLL